MDTETKSPLRSKTINGSIANLVGVLALLVSFFGFDLDTATQEKIIIAIVAVWQGVSSLLTIYGRFTATKSIKNKNKKGFLCVLFLTVSSLWLINCGAIQSVTEQTPAQQFYAMVGAYTTTGDTLIPYVSNPSADPDIVATIATISAACRNAIDAGEIAMQNGDDSALAIQTYFLRQELNQLTQYINAKRLTP
jgi:hypothetical protein